MQSLVEQAGNLEPLYRGEWKHSQRHGFGIQLFPNGAKYIGNWKRGMAEGFGRLEFVDGTFYEGQFAKNRILWGKLSYFNGTYFEGQFDGAKDLFKAGKLVFRDGEVFQGTWAPDGIVLTGTLLTDVGKVSLAGKNIVRDPAPGVAGKIIYWKKGIVYEGGLRRGGYDGRGFVYGNFMHPFYFECNVKKGKYDGRYLYNSLFYGFSTQEFYAAGKEVGTWRYLTSKGYEYVAETSTKSQVVRFPFLNRDYYEGEINMWCEKIVLVLGIYHQWEEPTDTYKQIRVINCDNITSWRNIRQRAYPFDRVGELIARKAREMKRQHFSSEAGLCVLEDGSVFRGAVVNDWVVCHRKDLVRLWDGRRAPAAPRSLAVGSPLPIVRHGSFSPDEFRVASAVFFRGTIVNGAKTGYCHIINGQGDEFRGFYAADQKSGFGFYSRANTFTYIGNFRHDQINGQGTMMVREKEMLKGEFINGLLGGLGYIKYFHSNIEFFGQVANNSRNGKGVLKFTNNYKFEGLFKDDEIDTSAEAGKLINKEEEMVEEGTFLPSRDQGIGLLQTVDGKFYVLDFKNGIVRKTS